MHTFQQVKSFADVHVGPDGVATQDFLDASDGLVRLFDLLGHGVFSFIQADIRGNIAVRERVLAMILTTQLELLCQGLRKRVCKYNDPTLEAVLAADDDKATGCLVRLIRGFRYICRALGTLQAHPELELYVCFKRAYDEVLREYHSGFVRTLVALAIRAAPSREDFYNRIGEGGDVKELNVELGRWVSGMERIVSHTSPKLPYH